MSADVIEQVLAAHQVEASGLNISTPDRCTCGEVVWHERGDEDATIRRRRAFAKHQAQALADAGIIPAEVEWGYRLECHNGGPVMEVDVRRYVTPWEPVDQDTP